MVRHEAGPQQRNHPPILLDMNRLPVGMGPELDLAKPGQHIVIVGLESRLAMIKPHQLVSAAPLQQDRFNLSAGLGGNLLLPLLLILALVG